MKINLKCKKTISVVICLLGLVLFLGLLTLTATHYIIEKNAAGKTYSDISLIPHRTAGLLLGCSQYRSGGRVNLFFQYRIEACARLYKSGKIDCIIASGDNHHVDYDEVSAMKENLIKAGVPADRIYCDYAGFRTIDSIIRAKAIFGQTEITVISQKFHNERAIYLAENRGIDAIGFNASDVSEHSTIKMRIREKFSRLKAFFDINVLNTKPHFYGPPIEISH